MEGVITIFFLRLGTLWCACPVVAWLTLLNGDCWGPPRASPRNSPPSPSAKWRSAQLQPRETVRTGDGWLRLQKCLFLSSESCHGYYFPSITWKANANAGLSKAKVWVSPGLLQRAGGGTAAAFRSLIAEPISRCYLLWCCMTLQHTVSIWYYAYPFHIQICFIPSVVEDLFLHYQWHILIIPDEEWTQWTAFPLFHSFSIWLLLAIIIQCTQKCVWIHPGIQSPEENTTEVKRKHCSTSAQASEDTYIYSKFINIVNDLSFTFPTISWYSLSLSCCTSSS